jgi:hypothetical protein
MASTSTPYRGLAPTNKSWSSKKRLYGANLANRVLYREIPVIELRMKRILDQFVISMILALARESDLPARTAPQIVSRDDFETPRKLRRLDSPEGNDLACRAHCRCFSHCLV